MAMKKMSRLVLAIVLMPSVIPLAQAATQFIGQIIQKTNTAEIGGVAISTGAGVSGTGTQRVILASDSPTSLTDVQLRATPVPVSASVAKSGNVVKSSVTATTTSTQLLVADSSRLGFECTSLCTNTDFAFLNINSAAAATVTDYPISPCSSWSPPEILISTGAVQVIANSGSQVVRCVSYTP